MAVRRLPPSGLHPSCGCGLETWFVVIGRAGAMGGRFWYHNPPGAGAEDKAKPEWKKACWVGWLCAVYGWLVLSRHPQPIPSLEGFPGSAGFLHGAIGPRSRVGLIEGREPEKDAQAKRSQRREKSLVGNSRVGLARVRRAGSRLMRSCRDDSRAPHSTAQHSTLLLHCRRVGSGGRPPVVGALCTGPASDDGMGLIRRATRRRVDDGARTVPSPQGRLAKSKRLKHNEHPSPSPHSHPPPGAIHRHPRELLDQIA